MTRLLYHLCSAGRLCPGAAARTGCKCCSLWSLTCACGTPFAPRTTATRRCETAVQTEWHCVSDVRYPQFGNAINASSSKINIGSLRVRRENHHEEADSSPQTLTRPDCPCSPHNRFRPCPRSNARYALLPGDRTFRFGRVPGKVLGSPTAIDAVWLSPHRAVRQP